MAPLPGWEDVTPMDPLPDPVDPLLAPARRWALSPLAVAAPRRFALCAEEPDEDGWHEVVGWGLEFEDDAVVYLRGPAGERSAHGVFGSADRARAHFSRVAPVHVVWA
jgi:hypothetical protein